ncbi:T9SS type B sorting domain-containing protein [Flavobacterium wongokense]|uniref:T9SS type B sorting domain-containing protein n=1 Tax=Flavobacterium wongokense TaxID=2910674 RepID=UPI001F15F7B9|nr:choice-of-anchor L domain-containing protein [Flavobacterium sp. WG47]MCF6132961.1 T9SS type B sorting domain-containing protein [Flavobacterium sp. WG47]
MKKTILLVAVLLSAIGFSQPISVSSTNYTVPQLVNNVLINSPCVSATNITWRTGTNFSSSNGLGYFQNTNPNFPMQSGVVLSTGNILNTPGPNSSLLNDGAAGWPGDTDLENTLAAAGISMVSKNATVLEFDFTPISPNFSFDFIFASEEYGNFQCLYSDAFAFLLTNVNTGVTTNLAVVPSTNLPISVVTIRDFLYNSSCPSVNPQYFGSFNGGSGAANSATNFNGQTKVLTAASVLTPNIPYHIKLVIADRADPQSDSAIFLSSDSFNIGQDVLGPDLTLANNTALCYGANHTISTGLSPTNYSFVWTQGESVMTGQTGPSINVTQPGTYTVTYRNIFSTCDPVSDSVVIEFSPEINSPNPNTLYRCDMGTATYTYNLAQNTPVVTQGLPAGTTVSYFATQNDADNNTGALPLNYNSASGATVYARIQLPGSQCFTTKSFQLQVSPPPVAHQAPNLLRCTNTSGQNTAYFNFNPQTPIVLGTQSPSIYSVSYYTSSANANSGTSPIADPSYGLYGNTTIYVRVQNISDPSCFSVSSFNLIVNQTPVVDVLQNVIVCDHYTLLPLTNGNYFSEIGGGGIPMFAGDDLTETQTVYIFNQPGGPGTCAANSSFRVVIVDEDELTPDDISSCGSYSLPSLTYGKYYTLPGGPAGGGVEIPFGTVITTSQLIYYYFQTTTPPICTVDSSFQVNIINNLNVGDRQDVFHCTSYVLPPLTLGNYFTESGGNGTQLAAGTPITTSQTIYVYAATTAATVCSDEDSFNVVIGIDQPADINQCNGYTLPALPIGNYFTEPMGAGTMIPAGTVINDNSTIYIYAPMTGEGTNCTNNLHFTLTFAQPHVDTLQDVTVCETYTLPILVNGEYFTGDQGTGTQLYAGDVILSTQMIYIFKRLDATCANQTSFTVTVNPLPAIDSRSDIDICDQYVLTPLTVGDYYTGPNGTGTIIPGNTVITTSQLIYIYAVSNTTPACSAQNSFQINIFSTTADSSPNISACDTYTLPTLTANNKYYTQSGGPLGTGTEIAPGTAITTTQTIFIFKESTIRTSFSCIDETSFVVTINNTPTIAPIANVTACNSYALPALTVGNYYTGTNASGNLLNAGDLITTNQTVYVYAHSATTPDCSSERNFNVTIFNVDNVSNVTTCENYTLPALTIGRYYTGPNGTGTQLSSGSVINTSTTVYIYATSPFSPACTDESSFTVTIIDTPVANTVPAGLRTVCDEDGTNDGVTSFDLTTLSATVLGTQTTSEFEVTYYESLANAATGTNPVTASNLAVVYVRVKNNLTANCFDIKPIIIIVNKLPMPTPVDGIVCIDSETGTLLNPYMIYSNLTSSGHHFVWTDEAGNTVATTPNYQATLPGVYTVVATNIATGCASDPVSVTVTPSEPALVTYEVSEDFADSQSITVTATGQGNNFEYQLDNGPFQDSNVFENVPSGMHTVTVRDKYGCGSTTIQALVVNYPKFFSPNGDGYNDSWNIRDLSTETNAKIIIYDRYGKMLSQIRPSTGGWDGTYNGKLMPSDDYWFSVSYTDEHQMPQEFRAHFAMKR